ncbi:glycosyltransferase family 2 protein [Phenylobacterium hankyongense]|uniref:Glycosyltransferase family 2 protein n=1 Tax=Phenylobacterium hankyongense TaxID=1813876 RepID=A0A328AZZ3_9CAUL|nr:glycosyltransferase family 2 protein [Phenylobacterium hankyongense]RAK59741.1 glycosyltransferase family 2 protein [Phenylobacterium hankyongense]
MKLSGLVCAHNEEARLAECLRGLAFCDEVVVVADRCTDRTQEIARQFGAIVIDGIFPLESQRKDAGIAACSGEWIFEVDADELVDPMLAAEVRATIEAPAQGDWFQVPVDNYVGKTLVRNGWGGSFGTSSVARLYRRGVKHWKPHRVHPGVTFEGRFAGGLNTPLRHKVDDDIGDMIDRLNRYTALRAADLADKGEPGTLGDNVFRGFRRFWKCYVGRKGRREGDLGFLIALMAGLYPVISHLRAKEILEARRSAPQEALGTVVRHEAVG